MREDVRVQPLETLGVAASRNAALDRTQTEFLLFGDDDIALDPAGISALLGVLETNSHLVIATGRRSGDVPARYSKGPRRLTLWNTAKTATPEIMVRLDAVRAAGLRFDEGFGLGAEHPLGDEYVFLADALRAGLSGRYVPACVGHHPGASTGAGWGDRRLLRARVAVLSRVFGPLAPLARLAFALKHRRRVPFWGFVLGRV